MARQRHQISTAAYRDIAQDIKRRVVSGEWGMGAELPGMRTLAREYGVSFMPINRAVAMLADEGVLRTEGKRGTFVASIPQPSVTDDLLNALPATAQTAQAIPVNTRLGVVLNYSPDETAEQLLANWELGVLRGIEQEFSAGCGSIHVVNQFGATTDSFFDDERFNAIICIGIHATQQKRDGIITQALRRSLPFVYISAVPLAAPVPHVFYDQLLSGYLAAKHLVDMGYERICFFSPYAVEWSTARYDGVVSALRYAGYAEHQLSWFPSERTNYYPHGHYVLFDEVTRASAHALARHVLSLTPSLRRMPTGIIAANDDIARFTIEALAEVGLTYGDDYGIIGFDDSEYARKIGLSSMRPPFAELGHFAAQMVLSGLRGTPMPQQLRVASHLIRRGSSHQLPVFGATAPSRVNAKSP